MDSVEVTAKKVEDAIKDGLKQLSATLDEVNVKVLEAGGLFRSARIVMTLTDEVKQARERRREKYEKRRRENERQSFEPRGVKQLDKHFEGNKQNERFANKNNQFAANNARHNDQPTAGTARPQGAPQPQRSQAAPQPKPQSAPPTKPQATPKAHEEAKSFAPKPENAGMKEAGTVPESSKEAALAFLKKTVSEMGIETEFEVAISGGELSINILSDDSALIGYRGETLDSLEYLAELVANKDTEKFVRLSLDCNGYRNKRTDSLVKLAEKMAAKCIKTGHKVSLEPMNSMSRKVIHAALSDNDKVMTRSEGKEPNRRVVIYFKREKGDKQDKPQNGKQQGKKADLKKPVDTPEDKAADIEELSAPAPTKVEPAVNEAVAPAMPLKETENAAAPAEETKENAEE